MIKVLKIVPNDFTNASRDFREITTLTSENYIVCVYAWYREGLKAREEGDFTVIRFRTGNSNSTGSKLISYIRFAYNCIKNAKTYKPDVISAHDLPALIIASVIKKIWNNKCKIVYDSHELTSEMESNRHQPALIVSGKIFAEKLLITKADAVMVVSGSIAEYNYKKYNLEKIPYVVRNIPELKLLQKKSPLLRNEFRIRDDEIVLLYQGVVRPGRGLEKLLEAMALLNKKIICVIMGYGDFDFVRKQVEELKLDGRVYLKEAVPYNELVEYSSGADIGISLIENYCLSYYYCLPNKMFEYIQSGLPVLCSSFPDMSFIVNRFGIGETADPEDINNIAEKIQLIVRNIEAGVYKKALEQAKNELCWEKEREKLIAMYENIVGS